MEFQFQNKTFHCMKTVVSESQNQEMTQELKLGDSMPDIGRIIGAWGQIILRGKEWRSDCVAVSGGVMGWVLYQPEDGTQPRTLDTWVPFQMKWTIPEETAEGSIRTSGLVRFLDARSVSPRKIMLRCGISAWMEAAEPAEQTVYIPSALPEDVALLHSTYPVRFCTQTGEKNFQMEEEIVLPQSAPVPEKLISYFLTPRITEKKVRNQRLAFTGTGELHLLYRSREGQLHSWDCSLPFSQLGELETAPGSDAGVDVIPAVTDLDLELTAEGQLRLKASLVGQYAIEDRVLLEVTEDACSPMRAVQTECQTLSIPAVLEERGATVRVDTYIPGDANVIVDAMILPEYPHMRRTDNGFRMELNGQFQVLCYGEDSTLQMRQGRWEASREIPAHEDTMLRVSIADMGAPQCGSADGKLELKSELQLQQKSYANQHITCVSGVKLGEVREPDPMRPSVILRRAGSCRLWDIAKNCGSTVEAIRGANQLEGEPEKDRMLLIPVV